MFLLFANKLFQFFLDNHIETEIITKSVYLVCIWKQNPISVLGSSFLFDLIFTKKFHALKKDLKKNIEKKKKICWSEKKKIYLEFYDSKKLWNWNTLFDF